MAEELAHQSVQRQMTTLAEAKNVGILFDATDITQHNVYIKFADSLKKEGKQVKLLGYIHGNANAVFNFDAFGNKNINWYHIPAGNNIQSFIENSFDILINAYFEENLSLEYISLLSRAKFRVGAYQQIHEQISDFMVQMKPEQNIQAFFDAINHYLHTLVVAYD
ncbi:MAG: hypothetical protein R2798_02800 [Chitinophagales bacterium]|nr:hypothetical protein [Bacteroidota bacterium]MCB9042257.1 hypothetical protein [Chitinophagales bacterium]